MIIWYSINSIAANEFITSNNVLHPAFSFTKFAMKKPTIEIFTRKRAVWNMFPSEVCTLCLYVALELSVLVLNGPNLYCKNGWTLVGWWCKHANAPFWIRFCYLKLDIFNYKISAHGGNNEELNNISVYTLVQNFPLIIICA